MISITSSPSLKHYNYKPMVATVPTFSAVDVSDYIAKGDAALNENRLNDALNSYSQAIQKNPNESVLYRKLGKTYFQMKDYESSETNYKKYIEKNSNDADALIELGEVQRLRGMYSNAISNFEKALQVEPNNDLAKRSILQTKNNMLAIFNPEQARIEKNEYATKNLKTALQMTVDYLTPSYMQDMTDVQIMFGETASMGGTSNIAQYENYKRTITISNDYIYAAPQVIAAYLTHESVHAKDKDAYTSVCEEQDAYAVATRFWMKHSKGVQDPEMDYAADLYQQSPATLASRVKEIYELRDPGIAQTSPNHPPEKKFHFNMFNKGKKAAQQSLQTYDIIA